MFKVNPRPTFAHTVRILVPVDGGHDEQSVKVTFRVRPGIGDDDDFDLGTSSATTKFLHEVIVDLDDLVDDQNQPVPYSDAVRDQVIGLPYVRAALVRGYFDAINKAALGN